MLTWAAEYGLQLMLGTGAAGWFALCWGTDRGWWERYRIKETWCQGCDHVQPSTSMRFTDSGLYWCSVCRADERQQEVKAKALQVAEEYEDGPRKPSRVAAVLSGCEDADCGCKACLHKREAEELRKELAEVQSWLAAERAQMKMLQRQHHEAERQRDIAPPEPGHWEWTGMGREWVADELAPVIKDIQLAGCTIPLYSPPTAAAKQARGHKSFCYTCEVTGNHITPECPQRYDATVVTGSGRIKEQQVPIAEPVAEGEPKPEWWLTAPGRWVRAPAEERRTFAEGGTNGEVVVRQMSSGEREVNLAVDGLPPQRVIFGDAYKDHTLAELADISCKLVQAHLHPLER